MADAAPQQTLNIPSLIAFALITFFFVRYFFFSSSSSTNSPSIPNTQHNRVSTDKIETIAAMFPQMSRRDIEWDLLRNGGSVQATSERILREGRLARAPPAFRAQSTPSTAGPTGGIGGAVARHGNRDASKAQHQDLITRYNLSSRLSSPEESSGNDSSTVGIQTAEVQRQQGAWSTSKTERQDLLRKRKEEMILAARRRMEASDKKRVAGS